MSVPGIGFHNALLILSELGEIGRFKRPESLVCYAGLAPKVEQSGEHVRYGHINKHNNGFLRWAFIQSARAAVRSSKPNRFQRIYNKIKARRKSGNRRNSSSPGGISLLGSDKEGIL